MRPDIERWDRDVTVRSFAWLYKACQDCVERWQKRQNTLQMHQTFHEQRSRSNTHSRERDRHPGAPGVVRRNDPLARKSNPSPSRSVRSGKEGRPRSSSGVVRETERLLGGAVRGIPRLPSRRGDSRLPGLPIDPAGSMPKQGNVSMVETAGLSTTRVRGIPGPLGKSLCTSGTATLDVWKAHCSAVLLSSANTSIRIHVRVRSLCHLVLLLVRLLKMRRRKPLGHLRPVLPIGRRGVLTAPLKD